MTIVGYTIANIDPIIEIEVRTTVEINLCFKNNYYIPLIYIIIIFFNQ